MAAKCKQTVDQLKQIFRERGIPYAGKSKEELVVLAERAVHYYDIKASCDHDEPEKKRRRVARSDGSSVDLYGKSVQWHRDLIGRDTPNDTRGCICVPAGEM